MKISLITILLATSFFSFNHFENGTEKAAQKELVPFSVKWENSKDSKLNLWLRKNSSPAEIKLIEKDSGTKDGEEIHRLNLWLVLCRNHPLC
jgi:hypothetical protein